MSATVVIPSGVQDPADPQQKAIGGVKNYKGFVGGVFSGIAKLSGRYESTAKLQVLC
jgi:solute carrier family 25 carnitine/acylcarnitine transporter 20/29